MRTTDQDRACQETRDLLDSYLSGELLVETNHGVQRHLAVCPSCDAERQRRVQLRATLKDALRVEVDTDSVRHRVRAQLDVPSGRSQARSKAIALTAAAAIVMVVAGGWFAFRQAEPANQNAANDTGNRTDRTAYVDAVVAHRECLLTIPSDRRFDPARVAVRLEARYHGLERVVGTKHGEFELIDAHTCIDGGRTYAHLIIRRRDRWASLLVHRTSRGVLPATEATVAVPGLDGPAHATRFDSYEAEAYQVNDHQLVVVSDMSRRDVETAGAWLLPAAARFVSRLPH